MEATYKLFCRTYHRDVYRLPYLLRSIAKFAVDFDGTVIACPQASLDIITEAALPFLHVQVVPCNSSDYDFIAQQVTKLTAHRYCDADIIVHIDSDCVFTETFSPADLRQDGGLFLLNCPYNYFYEEGINCPWQTVTSQFARRQVDYEFMRQFPLSYPRQLYADLEKWFSDKHGYLIDQIGEHVAGDHFSEFNLMGAFSYYSDYPYHKHINVLERAAPLFVRQMCLFDSRYDRTIHADELEVLENLLA